MRVVSLLPSATEMVSALGLADLLVGAPAMALSWRQAYGEAP